ncbi:exonuclease subunit SbcD [Nocardia sp. NBC_01730]|uniref:metallophosphoesterase family protein n=1 Tax=Nocardia sp. NBC_01730 TaxID=2975998 RepID=UPI002E142ABB|nr:exonuclease subunit SbcD [Nocardia sp. NBC_01730]
MRNTLSRMRILHTSDWHIGFRMRGTPLLAAQQVILVGEIPALVEEWEVDLVVVAGDIYDKTDPSEAEVAVCQDAFAAIRAAGAQLLVIAGNHDSPIRLGAGAVFTAAGGLHLMTSVAGIGSPVLFEDEHGPVAVYGVPCLQFAGSELGSAVGRSHADRWRAAMTRVRADLAGRPGARAVVVGHVSVADPTERGPERLRVGGRHTVPVEVFAGIDYVALGDLHWPHAVSPAVRYSGSPLPYVYDFGPRTIDFDPPKSVCMIDLDTDGLTSTTEVPLLMPSGLARAEGTLAELMAGTRSLDYIRATLTDAVRPSGAWKQLRRRFPFLVRAEWVDPVTASVTPLHPDEAEPHASLAMAMPVTGELWRGFYGEIDQPCLRCGAQPGRPCFQIRSALGASSINTFHRERGLNDAELARLGYQPYEVDDQGTRRQLWRTPGQWQVQRDGCHALPPAPPTEQPDAAAGPPNGAGICAAPGCAAPLKQRRGGRPALYCSPKCRVRAHRARIPAAET